MTSFYVYLDNIVSTEYVTSFAEDKTTSSSTSFSTSFPSSSSVKNEKTFGMLDYNKNSVKDEIIDDNSLLCADEKINEDIDIIDKIEVNYQNNNNNSQYIFFLILL